MKPKIANFFKQIEEYELEMLEPSRSLHCQIWWDDYGQIAAFPVYSISARYHGYCGHLYCRMYQGIAQYVYIPDSDCTGLTPTDLQDIKDAIDRLNQEWGVG